MRSTGHQTIISRLLQRLHTERGEGVISTGIAVLIMALIGAAMWVAFNGVFTSASETIKENTDCIANNTCEE
jgi:hypothetical protein